MNRTAIVCSGGGMRCAYSAGALVALAKVHTIRNPDFIFAASGGAGGAMYYTAHQYEAIKDIWTRLLSTPKFISFLRPWRIMDIDYLIDTVFKKQQPLDTETIYSSPTRYFIPLTNAKTGEVRYISQADNIDLFEVLRATKAIPVAYGKKVLIDTVPYIDGALRICMHDMVQKALELGATRVLAIDTSRDKKSCKKRIEDPRVLYFTNTSIPKGVLNNRKKDLQRSFDLGYTDVSQNKLLKDWLVSE